MSPTERDPGGQNGPFLPIFAGDSKLQNVSFQMETQFCPWGSVLPRSSSRARELYILIRQRVAVMIRPEKMWGGGISGEKRTSL